MSFSVKVELNHKSSSDGRHSVLLRLTKDRKYSRIKTGHSVVRKAFNTKAVFGKWIRSTEPRHAKINTDLLHQYNELVDFCNARLKENNASGKELLEAFKEREEISSLDWIDFFVAQEDHYNSIGKTRYAIKIKVVRKKLEAFLGTKKIRIESTDIKLMDGFKAYLHGLGNSVNTVNHNLKIIKSIYRRAIKQELVKVPSQRVLNYELKGTSVERDKLVLEEVRAIEESVIKEGTGAWHAKNFFLFSFYMAGIRFTDFAELRGKNILDGSLRYVMHKTGKVQHLKLHEKASKILEQYESASRSDESFLFPLLPFDYFEKSDLQRVRISGAKNALVNKNLKKVAEIAGIKKRLSFHTARHSFAYIAFKKTKDPLAVQKALQHSKLKETQDYITSLANEGERDILGEIFG